MSPQRAGRMLVPVGGDANAGTAAIAVGTAKTRPVARLKLDNFFGHRRRRGFGGRFAARFCQEPVLGCGAPAVFERSGERARHAVQSQYRTESPTQKAN